MRRTLAIAVAAWALAGCAGGTSPTPEGRFASARHNNLGVALMDHGEYVEAEREFRASIDAWGGHVTARVNLGIALYYDNRHEEARTAFEAALRQDPDDLRAHYMLGLVDSYHAARHGDAARHFATVAAADPDDPWVQFYLGLALNRARRPADASVALRRAVALSPGHQAALYQLSLALRNADRVAEADEALARFKHLRETFPGTSAPGVGYMEQGRYAEALPSTFDDGRTLTFDPAGADPATGEVARALAGPSWSLRGDVDNDGVEETLAIAPGRVTLEGTGGDGAPRDRTEEAGLTGWADAVTGGAFADVDHDGDLDIFLTRDAAPDLLLRNDGLGRFVETAAAAGVDGGAARSSGVAFADYDDDRAIDLLVSRKDGPPRVFYNNRDGTFMEMSGEAGLGDVAPAAAVSAGDVDHDGWVDVVFTPSGGGPPDLRLGGRGRRFRRPAASLAGVAPDPPDRCALHDADRDGDLDIVCAAPGGARVLRNGYLTANAARTLRVIPHGLIRPQVLSNYSGLGVKVEVRAPGMWLRREVRASTSEIPDQGILLGLGDLGRMDYLRLLFPSGVRLTRRDVETGGDLTLEEPAGKFTSCPMIYTWDGERFRFINDTLGFGILGEWEPPGRWMTPDPDEWVAIPGDALRAASEGYRVRFVNQLEEITFADTLRLVAVDHPADVEVHPVEPDRVPGQADAAPRLHVVHGARPPLSARDDAGRDVIDRLLETDGRFVDGFGLLPWKGIARPHALILDLGPFEADSPALVLTGWTEWGSSSSLRAASQAGVVPLPIRLDVPDGDRWRTAIPNIGLPAGLPRTLVVPIDGLHASDDHRVRLHSNLLVYWDRIAVAFRTGRDGVRVTEVPLARAELRRLGYPRPVEPAQPGLVAPVAYDYADLGDEAEWGILRGAFTRLGDVMPLLARRDDRFVIMNHGEEIALTFDASAVPDPGAGQARIYLFYAHGYGKDRDINSAAPSTVLPIPWQEMPGYPPEGDSPDLDRIEWRLEWNTRGPGAP